MDFSAGTVCSPRRKATATYSAGSAAPSALFFHAKPIPDLTVGPITWRPSGPEIHSPCATMISSCAEPANGGSPLLGTPTPMPYLEQDLDLTVGLITWRPAGPEIHSPGALMVSSSAGPVNAGSRMYKLQGADNEISSSLILQGAVRSRSPGRNEDHNHLVGKQLPHISAGGAAPSALSF